MCLFVPVLHLTYGNYREPINNCETVKLFVWSLYHKWAQMNLTCTAIINVFKFCTDIEAEINYKACF